MDTISNELKSENTSGGLKVENELMQWAVHVRA